MDIKLPDISDALKPLPRLKSVVITELENISRKTPIDRKVFGYVFLGVFAFLLAIAFALPMLRPKPVEAPAPVVAAEAPPPPLTQPQITAAQENDSHWLEPLPQAPIAELQEPLGNGFIPITAPDGRVSWHSYARPYNQTDARPRITVVIGELGLSQQISQTAITDLPGPVTLIFSKFSNEPDAWMAKARQLGHETLLSIPMEPLDYPSSDPGTDSLLIHNNNDENKALLLKYLVNGKGYIGVTSLSGSRMSTTPERFRPILEELNKRGLMWLDANLTPLSAGDILSNEIHMPSAKADIHIDENMGSSDITQILQDVEKSAFKNGHAILIVQPSPLSLSLLRDWVKQLPDKRISLAPLSSLAK